MDTRESNLAWIIAGILLVLLIVVGYLWLSSRDLPTVLEDGREDISAQRDAIAESCEGPNRDEEECKENLEELAEILREFSADVDAAATSTSN